MTLRLVIARAALLVACLLLAARAEGAAGDRKELQLNGRAVDAAGKGIAGARITASGDAVITLSADAEGRFTLRVPVGTVAEVTRHPMRFAVEARHGGRRLRVDGATRLEIEIAGATGPDSERMDAKSNVAAFAERLTRALGEPGDGIAAVDLTFGAERPASPPRESRRPPAPAVAPTPTRAAPAPPPVAAADPAPATPAASRSATPARKPKSEPSAMEVLESARRLGTILATPDSTATRAADRESLRAAREQQRLYRRERELLDAAARAAEARRRDARRDSLRVAERMTEAQRDSARAAERAAAAARARLREAEIAERDARAIARRDSALAALRVRDSLAAFQRARESIAEEARQDSLRALRVAPRLDPRPPVAGRSAGADTAPPRPASDSCVCKVEGTVEVRSTRPLTAPFAVTVAVRGRPALRDRVTLYMGAPREFTIPRVPCGTWELDVTPDPGKRFALDPSSRSGAFECRAASLSQHRFVLVPR